MLANETFGDGSEDASCARRGQRHLRKAMLELYQPGPNMFSGDEDNGEMGAWFVLSALGLYSLAPSSQASAVELESLTPYRGSLSQGVYYRGSLTGGPLHRSPLHRGFIIQGVPYTGGPLKCRAPHIAFPIVCKFGRLIKIPF